MLLGDLGADVVKVEQPGTGDPFRAFKGGLYSPHFQTYNRNKRSITLEHQGRPTTATRFDALIADADVYIQNFRPGVAEKLGRRRGAAARAEPAADLLLDQRLRRDGPAAHRPSYDTVAQAASGYLRCSSTRPTRASSGPAIADAVTGFYAAYGVLGALYERGAPAAAARVEVSMLEAMAHFNLDAFTHYFSAGEVMGPYSRPSVSQSYVMRCADGKWLALHMSSPEKFWQGLAKAIERPRPVRRPALRDARGRIENQEALIEVLGERSSRRSDAREWCRRLEAHDVPHAPMYDTSEALDDPQARHLQLLVEAEHPTMGPSAPCARRCRSTASARSTCGRRRCSASTTTRCAGWSRAPLPGRSSRD